MILQKLYNDYNLNIEHILLKEYRRLELTLDELVVLLALFDNKSKVKVFSLSSISKKVEYSENELAHHIQSLINKEFIKIELDQSGKREREVYNLDKTFAKITDLLNMEIQESKQIKNKNNITETIQLLEQRLNRMLRIDELERIKTWYEDFSYVHQNIIDAINAIDRGVTILKIEKLLNIDINEDEAIDPNIEASLERIFKKL